MFMASGSEGLGLRDRYLKRQGVAARVTRTRTKAENYDKAVLLPPTLLTAARGFEICGCVLGTL